MTPNLLAPQVEAVVAPNIERGVEARRSLLRRLLPPALRDSEDTVHTAPPKVRSAPLTLGVAGTETRRPLCHRDGVSEPAGQHFPLWH